MSFFNVREMSGNFEICQGKIEFWKRSGKTDLYQGKIKFPGVHAHSGNPTDIPQGISLLIISIDRV